MKVITILSVLLLQIFGTNGLDRPKSYQEVGKSWLKPAIVSGTAVAGLIFGKKLLNGPKFNEQVMLQGKNVFITGGNTGLGKETALKLADLGANVYLLCKSKSRGEKAVEDIKTQLKDRLHEKQIIKCMEVDLGDLSSIRQCAIAIHKEVSYIDVLINNAGIMAVPTLTFTKDNFESHLGVNHLGHFALTGLLMDLIRYKKPTICDKNNNNNPSNTLNGFSRIVNVASAAHVFGNIDKENLMLDKKPNSYEPWPAYGRSKLANILFTKELARRLAKDCGNRLDTIAVSCHPGVCRTELGRYLLGDRKIPSYFNPVFTSPLSPIVYFTKSAEEGAQTQIFLSSSQRVTARENGKYFDNSHVSATSNKAAEDDELAAWLWKTSEQLTGVKFLSD